VFLGGAVLRERFAKGVDRQPDPAAIIGLELRRVGV
jgi:hypothetical protein